MKGSSLRDERGEEAIDEEQRRATDTVHTARLKWRKLDDLAPHYVPELHSSYLRALLEGIETHDATNIALSGSYGAGKSSILEGLQKRYASQTIQVSLATVRAPEESTNGKATPTPSANDLQKEIVKQILYVVDPSKTPASRFPRTSKFQWFRAFRGALLAGLAGAAVQWLVTLIIAFAQADATFTWRPVVYLPTFLGVTLIVLLLLRLTNGRLAISDFTAGPAKLTLSDKSGSYFDDYLDEIVYFFQVSKKRILILEDMDRFDNVEVFEDLRALNVLLNHSAQLQTTQLHGKDNRWSKILRLRRPAKPVEIEHANLESLETIPEGFHDGPIVFVYAIRDSLLADTVQATSDVHHDPFTRTKFFDLIVPVVPFVTQQNARGALKKELKLLVGEESSDPHTIAARPSDSLVRAIAQYFPDQRQIRNIRNEFAMYRDRLLQPGKHPEELTADRLLALVLYKNLEVADFERIRLGKGKLHWLLRLSQALVTENLQEITTRLSHPSPEALQAQAEDLARRLLTRARPLGIQFQEAVRRPGYSSPHYRELSLEDLSDVQRWMGIAAGRDLVYGNGRTLDRDAIEKAFDTSLNFADAKATPLSHEQREQLVNDRDELERATWLKLWTLPQFALAEDSDAWGEMQSRPDCPLSFAQIATKVMGEGLASELIAAGNLTQNFALLSARFDSEFLGIEAQNFAAAVTETPGRRHLFAISHDAIREVLAEHTATILERSGMVNIHVLEYLLISAPHEIHRVLAQLRSWTADDQTFMRDFCSRYSSGIPLEPLANAFGYLTSLAPNVLAFIATDSSISEAHRVKLFDTALGRVRVGELPTTVATNETVRRYAQDVQSSLDSLAMDDKRAIAAANCLVELNTTIHALRPLSNPVREVFVAHGLFDMTTANLSVIVGDEDPRWVSLERLRDQPEGYQATIARVDEYLAITDPGDADSHEGGRGATAESAEGLIGILSDLAAGQELTDADDLLRIIAGRSDPSIAVEELQGIDGTVQEALLLEDRALHTTSNLAARVISAGRATLGIATALRHNARPLVRGEADLSTLAVAVLTASHTHPDLLTANVVGDFLDQIQDHVELEEGTLLATTPPVAVRLIGDGWGDRDDLRAAATIDLDWTIREALLAADPEPDVAQTQQLLGPEDTLRFLNSTVVPNEVRAYAPFLVDTLLGGAHGQRNADAIARYLHTHRIGTDLPGVHRLAQAGAARAPLLALLCIAPARTEFEASPTETLNMLGGKYAAIISRDVRTPPTFDPTSEHNEFLALLEHTGIIRMRTPGRDGTLRITRLGGR